jgi:hypothetical protein
MALNFDFDISFDNTWDWKGIRKKAREVSNNNVLPDLGSNRCCSISIPDQMMWNLWWTKWNEARPGFLPVLPFSPYVLIPPTAPHSIIILLS